MTKKVLTPEEEAEKAEAKAAKKAAKEAEKAAKEAEEASPVEEAVKAPVEFIHPRNARKLREQE